MNIIKPEGLEKLLIANWTQVLDVKAVYKFINENIDSPINNLTITRFEPQENGFLLWIEFNYVESLKKVYVNAMGYPIRIGTSTINITIEAFLKLSGEIQFIK